MPDDFPYDVFLSHSAKDKVVVRPLAERLRKDGVKVWFDEWVLKPGDSIPAKIEDGLERSRVLVLCMSANAFGSDWAQLESGTFRFRDPLNQERRFIPLRLDDARIKGSLAQFLYINWQPAEREREYARLLESCRSEIIFLQKGEQPESSGSTPPTCVGSSNSSSDTKLVPVRNRKGINILSKGQMWQPIRMLKGHHGRVFAVALSNDAETVVSAGSNGSIRIWDVQSGECIRTLKGHEHGVRDLVLSSDGRIYSACVNGDIGVWDFATGELLTKLEGHLEAVYGLAISRDGKVLVSGSRDCTIRVWDADLAECRKVLDYGKTWVNSVSILPGNRRVVAASEDGIVALWDIQSGQRFEFPSYHTGWVWSIALSAATGRLISGSSDSTVGLWDLNRRKMVRILEGHRNMVSKVAITRDGKLAVSGSLDTSAAVWDLDSGTRAGLIEGHKASVESVAISDDGRLVVTGSDDGHIGFWFPNTNEERKSKELEFVTYSNAKVLLVGESGVGKTGLSNYLAHGIKVVDDKPLPSTDGAWATHWPLQHDQMKTGVEREIWLWDFAGQVDYRLVHQLFMDDTAAAVLVFNPQNENPFEGLGHWDRDLQKAARKPFAKLLAAARIDRGGLVVSAASMKKFMKERGFDGTLHETSAKTGKGCDQLREAIMQAIDWKSIPETTSPALYHRLKQEILSLRDSGLVLIRLAELKQRMEMTLRGENFELAELEAVVGLLAGPGMIQRLDFGGFILLRPEVLSRYAAAVVRKVRKHPQELGCIREDELLTGDLDYQDFKRLPREDEEVVLRTLLETFISRAWCLRQPCDGSAMLTFPSYFRRERKEQPNHPSVLVTYRFDVPADDIYATLVVRLHHTVAFQSTDLWKSAADFKTQTGTKLGFTLTREAEGSSRLEVYFEPDVDGNSRVLFLRYVHDHLMQHAQNVARLRRYFCGDKKCDAFGLAFGDQAKIAKALAPGGKGKVFCPDCGKPILLRDVIEEKFDSPAVKEQVREMQSEGQAVIDNESRELLAAHHTGFIVAEAGQIYRGYTNSDHGIDGEIEFKDDQGRASGKRLYVQLKSGDSYLKKRERDGAEVFQIKNPRWADYWQQQAYAVMLVVRTSDGEIRWMDVSAYLKRESAGGKTVRQIVFAGERFDAVSVQNWRKRVLGGGLG